MLNFEYKNPVKIIFGEGQIEKIVNEIPADAKVLMTYGGGSIKKNGVYNQVTKALADYNVIEFGGIEPNPRFETLMKAVLIARDENIDFLLAVGGGSVLDGTKFISAAINFEGDEWEILSKWAVFDNPIPVGTVLTLPATGSEMNGNAVVTKDETKEKLSVRNPLLMPKFSVMDPSILKSLPKRQRVNGIVDAFIHTIENYLTYNIDAKVPDMFSESILKVLISEADSYCNTDNYKSAANVMWAATMALNGLMACGVPTDWATHMIGHELTAMYEIDHARTLAIVLPGMMMVRSEQKRDKLIAFAENVWGIDQGDDDEKISLAIYKTEQFFNSLGVKTKLGDYNIDESMFDEMKERLTKHNMLKLSERGDLGPDIAIEILKERL